MKFDIVEENGHESHGTEAGTKRFASGARALEFLNRNVKRILLFYLIAVSATILFALLQGDDIDFHLQRLDAIMQEFRHSGFSAFPIRLYHVTAYGYGYASPLYYGDFFMWPYAVLAVLLDLSVLTGYKIMLSGTLIATWLMARFSFGLVLRDHEKDVAVFLYVVSVTILDNVAGSCLGRAFATMFTPLCLCSFYRLLYGEAKQHWKSGLLLSLGMSGLLYSNLLDALIVAFSLCVILLFSLRKITGNKLLVLLSAALLCIGLTAWFVGPMLEQMADQTVFVSSDEVNLGMNDLRGWTMPLIGILLPARIATFLFRLLGLEVGFSWAYFYGMLFYMLLTALLFTRRREVFDKNSGDTSFYCSLFALVLLYMLFQTKLFPHRLFSNLIGVMQFPWRVEIVMISSAGLLTARLLQTTHSSRSVGALVLLSICMVLAYGLSTYGISAINVFRNDSPYAVYTYSSDSLGNGEYLPLEFLEGDDRQIWKKRLQSRGSVVLCDDESVPYSYENGFDSVSISYSSNTGATTFELPRIYYKGYTAEDPGSGKRYAVHKNAAGLVCVTTAEEAGTIIVSYTGTDIQRISERISLSVSILLFGTLGIISLKRRKVSP